MYIERHVSGYFDWEIDVHWIAQKLLWTYHIFCKVCYQSELNFCNIFLTQHGNI